MKHNTIKVIMAATSERAAATGSGSDCFVCCACVDVCTVCFLLAVILVCRTKGGSMVGIFCSLSDSSLQAG